MRFLPMILAGLLVLATPASASEPGASVVLDQPDGFTDPFTGAGNHSGVTGDRAISADGRFVVFTSAADGLSGDDDDRVVNVYRKDRATGELLLISAGANSDADEPQISNDGDRVVFSSRATTLDPAATDGRLRIFVRDVDENRTFAVAGAEGSQPVISGDGEVVAFSTRDPIDSKDGNGRHDVYVQRIGTGGPVLVSRQDGADGAVGDRDSYDPSISRDGKHVAFTSGAALEPGADANGVDDVYRRGLTSSVTDLISNAGTKAGNGPSREPSISAVGNVVAFQSRATDLDSQAIDDADGRSDVFVAVGGAALQLTPVAAAVPGAESTSAAVAADGSAVAFQVTVPAEPEETQVAVRSLGSKDVQIASATPAGAPGGRSSAAPSLSGDGRVVAFGTEADGLGDGIGGDWGDVVARNLDAERTELVSAPPGGPLPEDLEEVSVAQGTGSVSPDARFAVFSSGGDGLGRADRGSHVYLRDARSGRTELVDRADGADGAPAGRSFGGSVSADGRHVAFVTDSRLAAGDQNDVDDAYVRDTVADTTRLASAASDGTALGVVAIQVALSADGRRVAFTTEAADPSVGDANAYADVHVHDLVSGERFLASRGALPADAPSTTPAISADGSVVAFVSTATNLGPLDTDTAPDVFVRDLVAGTTELASRRGNGTKAPQPSVRPSLSADGRRVAFQSEATLADDTDTTDDIYVFDRQATATVLVSRAAGVGGAKGNARSSLPSISADGTAVAFRSGASNLGGAEGDVFVRRLDDASLVSMGYGRPGDLSGDGSCLVMSTNSPALIASSPDFERVLLRAVRSSCELPAAPVETPAPGPVTPGPTAEPTGTARAPRLSRVSLSRRRFAARRGTVVRFRLDQNARVRFVVRARGRRRLALSRAGRAGRNRVRLAGRRLRPGRYVLTARARNATGASAPRRVAFRVIRPR